MADIQRQLAALLGKSIVTEIRRTNEEPPRVSVIDVVAAITGKDANNAARDIGLIKGLHPEVTQNLGIFKFAGRGQKNTPVASARGIVEIIMLLPGHHAAKVRRQAAQVLVRYLGGDLAIIDDRAGFVELEIFMRLVMISLKG